MLGVRTRLLLGGALVLRLACRLLVVLTSVLGAVRWAVLVACGVVA